MVGTPGRLIDLARPQHLDLCHVRTLVLDEADEMLDLGFLPDVERILALTPDAARRCCSRPPCRARSSRSPAATCAADAHPRDRPGRGRAAAATEQHVYRAHQLDKHELIARAPAGRGPRPHDHLLPHQAHGRQRVADDLVERGFAAAAVHGDLGQGAREQALRAFRNGKVDVLVATDVAARGIDVDDVTHVINYECPDDDKTYLHRIGRTGRAGQPASPSRSSTGTTCTAGR